MDALWLPAATAFWLGILTSISPCPLATNLAAVSYIGRDANRPLLVMQAGLLYTLGRVIAYAALASLIVWSVLSAPGTAIWLQTTVNLFLGPVLVLVGMVLLGLLKLPSASGDFWTGYRQRVQKMGLAGAGLLGFLFALSFCPVSAALYFGSLIPLAINGQSPFWLPAIYGVGTGLPVLGFAIALIFGAQAVSRTFQGVSSAEKWLRPATGIAIVGVGIYLTLVHVFHIM
jgi:cytochrome c-type biogenesis protein